MVIIVVHTGEGSVWWHPGKRSLVLSLLLAFSFRNGQQTTGIRSSKESPKSLITPLWRRTQLSEGLKEEQDHLKMHFLPEENEQNPSATAP